MTTIQRDERDGYDEVVGALRGYARNLAARGEDTGRIADLMVGESRRLRASDRQRRQAVKDLQNEGVLPTYETTEEATPDGG